jgi:hypothetical protein
LSVPFLSFVRGASRHALMPDHRPRSSYEPDWLPYTKAASRRAVRITIGQELRALYEIPQDLPHEMLTLLMQVNAPHEEA